MLLIQYKNGTRENFPVRPEDLDKTFLENEVEHQCTLLLVEFRNMRDSDDEEEDMEEGGEDEQEEVEEGEEEGEEAGDH